MTPHEALGILNELYRQVALTADAHDKVREAFAVLTQAISPQMSFTEVNDNGNSVGQSPQETPGQQVRGPGSFLSGS
jgi:hypothetical protein